MLGISIAMFGLLAATAFAADDVTGHYLLRGVREVGSELLVQPDGKFQYMLAYGAADYMAAGTWKREGDSIVLNTVTKGDPPFKLLKSSASPEEGIRITVKGPGGHKAPNIDVFLKLDGKVIEGRTDSAGIAAFPRGNKGSVRFVIDVYQFQSEEFPLPAGHNELEFQINGEAITTVKFVNEPLKVNGRTLEMRFWDKNRVLNYEKQ